MVDDRVSLRFAPRGSYVRLRELTGRDERAVAGISTSDALALLDGLFIGQSGGQAPLSAEDLVASDRDRLLAAVYRRAFGDRIENTLACRRCASPFDIDFSLKALTDSLDEGDGAPAVRPLGENRFETRDGARFRLPIGRDERVLADLPAAEAETALLNCCVADSSVAADAGAIQELLAEIAPLIDLELEARCPECGNAHSLQFDIQSYLLGALIGEQGRLAQEIHRLAVAYGWGLQEILSLSRGERRRFVELVDNQSARLRRGAP